MDGPRHPHRRQRVDQTQGAEALREFDGGGEGDDPAPVVTDQVDPLEAERVEEVDHVAGEQLAGHPHVRLVGGAEAPGVGGEDGVAGVGERTHLVAPLVGGLREPVQQHDGLARALLEVVDAQTGRLHEGRRHGHGLAGSSVAAGRRLR